MKIAENVQRLRQHVDELCAQQRRSSASLRVIAVTKTQEVAVLRELAAAGLSDFAENRLEHLQTMQVGADPAWRFHGIGRVQGRQLPEWAAHCDSLHSLHDPGHVERLAAACARAQKCLPVFIQVNTSGEAVKAGLDPAQLEQILAACQGHPQHLAVQGLMCMAPQRAPDGSNDAQIRHCFAALRILAERFGLPRLSMGMSGDYDLAIAEGATDLRVGSLLFV